MITVSLLKDYLQISGTSDTTGNDTILAVALADAVSEVEAICNRKFTSGTYTQYVTGDNSTTLSIKNYPVLTVQSIEYYNGVDGFESIFTSPDSTANSLFIVPDTNSVQLLNGYTLPCSTLYDAPSITNNIKVVYTSGWADDACNADLKGVLLEMASVFYFNSPNSGKARIGLSSENMASQASESSSFKDLYPEWKKRLEKYKIRRYK